MTDEALVALTRHPETREAGLRQLVIHYQQRLYQVIRRQVGNHEDADDVLQNTFLKIFRHLDGFESRSGLFTWMYRIATNEVINFHKQKVRNQTVDVAALAMKKGDSFLDTEDLVETLERIICRLPDRQQTVFRMRYYDELTYKDIAEILQLTEGALKASFHHAVRKIEEELKARQIV